MLKFCDNLQNGGKTKYKSAMENADKNEKEYCETVHKCFTVPKDLTTLHEWRFKARLVAESVDVAMVEIPGSIYSVERGGYGSGCKKGCCSDWRQS